MLCRIVRFSYIVYIFKILDGIHVTSGSLLPDLPLRYILYHTAIDFDSNTKSVTVLLGPGINAARQRANQAEAL